jgi:hypothetical protein
MTGEERLEAARRLYWPARKTKAVGLRAQHPDWPEPRIEDDVRRIFSNANVYSLLRNLLRNS